ncbi:hypothetical protein JCM11491_003345 [Sporobolomyces phaffii]
MCSSQHLGCHDCLSTYFGSGSGDKTKPCPVCRAPVAATELKPVPFIERVVKSLDAKCKASNCDWRGALAQREAHFFQSCLGRTIECEKCKVMIPALRADDHLVNHCGERLIRCPRGDTKCPKFHRKNSATHEGICTQFQFALSSSLWGRI